LIPKGAEIVLQVHITKAQTGKNDSHEARFVISRKRRLDKRLRVFTVTKLPLRIPADEANI